MMEPMKDSRPAPAVEVAETVPLLVSVSAPLPPFIPAASATALTVASVTPDAKASLPIVGALAVDAALTVSDEVLPTVSSPAPPSMPVAAAVAVTAALRLTLDWLCSRFRRPSARDVAPADRIPDVLRVSAPSLPAMPRATDSADVLTLASASFPIVPWILAVFASEPAATMIQPVLVTEPAPRIPVAEEKAETPALTFEESARLSSMELTRVVADEVA